jgi:hypothetical protein
MTIGRHPVVFSNPSSAEDSGWNPNAFPIGAKIRKSERSSPVSVRWVSAFRISDRTDTGDLALTVVRTHGQFADQLFPHGQSSVWRLTTLVDYFNLGLLKIGL